MACGSLNINGFAISKIWRTGHFRSSTGIAIAIAPLQALAEAMRDAGYLPIRSVNIEGSTLPHCNASDIDHKGIFRSC